MLRNNDDNNYDIHNIKHAKHNTKHKSSNTNYPNDDIDGNTNTSGNPMRRRTTWTPAGGAAPLVQASRTAILPFLCSTAAIIHLYYDSTIEVTINFTIIVPQ